MVMSDIADICVIRRLLIVHTNVGVRIFMVVMGRIMRMFVGIDKFVRPRRDVDTAEQDSKRQKYHGDIAKHRAEVAALPINRNRDSFGFV